MQKVFILFLMIAIIFSCKKDAGKGGTSIIKGSVTVKEYSKYNNQLIRTLDAIDKSVYIIYDNNDYYGDRVKTNSNGYYEFKGLQKGNYKIYAYSETSNYAKEAVYVNVNISSNSSTNEANEIKITNFTDKGNASITGRLFVFDYKSDFSALKDTFYGPNRYIYLAFKNNKTYIDKIKTNPDGYFKFNEILPGDYEVYAYSKTPAAVGEVAIKKYFSIKKFDENIELPRLEIID